MILSHDLVLSERKALVVCLNLPLLAKSFSFRFAKCYLFYKRYTKNLLPGISYPFLNSWNFLSLFFKTCLLHHIFIRQRFSHEKLLQRMIFFYLYAWILLKHFRQSKLYLNLSLEISLILVER